MHIKPDRDLTSLSGSLLIPLYIRAIESQRTDALLMDKQAVEIISKLELDDTFLSQSQVEAEVQVSILLRNRQFDRYARYFLTQHPNGVVIHLGCGLDARFERVDNGKVEWYDLDLPEVIELRRKLIGDESDRYHLLACSALDPTWMDEASFYKSRPFLFLAEGLFMFFAENQVRELVLALKDSFPNPELIFDAFSSFYVWGNNHRVARTKIGAKAHWALKNSKELESWGNGIHLVSEWYPFLAREPRLAHIRWVRFIPLLAKTTGIFHYRLEQA